MDNPPPPKKTTTTWRYLKAGGGCPVTRNQIPNHNRQTRFVIGRNFFPSSAPHHAILRLPIHLLEFVVAASANRPLVGPLAHSQRTKDLLQALARVPAAELLFFIYLFE